MISGRADLAKEANKVVRGLTDGRNVFGQRKVRVEGHTQVAGRSRRMDGGTREGQCVAGNFGSLLIITN